MKTFSAMWDKELGKAIKEAVTEPYVMSLRGHDRLAALNAINQGIDSYLEACFVPARGDRYEDNEGTLHCVVSPESMVVLVRRLTEAGEIDLASSICYCLDIELI